MNNYKHAGNMTGEENKEFAKNPYEWTKQQLKSAVNHDPIVFKCYEVFTQLHKDTEEDVFENVEFLTLLAHMALIAHSVSHEQLVEVIQNSVRPTTLVIPVSDN